MSLRSTRRGAVIGGRAHRTAAGARAAFEMSPAEYRGDRGDRGVEIRLPLFVQPF